VRVVARHVSGNPLWRGAESAGKKQLVLLVLRLWNRAERHFALLDHHLLAQQGLGVACERLGNNFFFFFLQFPELLDTAILVLRKKPVIFLHVFHHAIMTLM
jgi:hypothetical protein